MNSINILKRFQNTYSGIRLKYIISVISLFAVGVVPLSIFFISRIDHLLKENLKEKLALIEKNLSVIVRNSLEESNYSSLHSLVKSISQKDKEIISIVIMDQSYTVVATSDEKKYPLFYKMSEDKIIQKIEKKDTEISFSNEADRLENITFIYYEKLSLISYEFEEEEISKIEPDSESFSENRTKINESEEKILQGVMYFSLSTKYLQKEVNGLWFYSIISLFFILLLGFFIAYAIATGMSRPLVSLADSVRKISKGNLSVPVKLDIKRRDEIGQLFMDVDSMRFAIKSLTDDLEEKVRQRTHELQMVQEENSRILETMTSGLMSIDHHYKIGYQYSKITEKILMTDQLSQANFMTILKNILPEEKVRIAKKYINVVFNKGIYEQFLVDLNPLRNIEARFKNGQLKYLEFGFLRIKDKRGNIIGLMVLVMDVTESYLLFQKLAEQEEMMNIQMKQLHAILNVDPKYLTIFIHDSEDDMQNIRRIISKGKITRKDIDSIHRTLHSIKGNASVLNLNFISSVAHSGEEKIIEIRKKKSIDSKDIFKINNISKDIGKALEGIHELVKKLKRFKIEFQTETKTDIGKMTLNSMVKIAEQLSSSLNKNIEFVTKNFDHYFINDQNRKMIKDIFIQLMRNAVVHGIENFEERKKMGKLGTAKITLSNQRTNKFFWCTFQDDGRGLNIDEIREKAIRLKKMTEKDAYSLEDKKIMKLIFMPGFSTKKNVDMHAGRGIGMDIIKKSIDRLGGKIRVDSKDGQYFRIDIGLPLSSYRNGYERSINTI